MLIREQEDGPIFDIPVTTSQLCEESSAINEVRYEAEADGSTYLLAPKFKHARDRSKLRLIDVARHKANTENMWDHEDES